MVTNTVDLHADVKGISTGPCRLHMKSVVSCSLSQLPSTLLKSNRRPAIDACCGVRFTTAAAHVAEEQQKALTEVCCGVQFTTAAVHAAEEQQKACSQEAKHQELFPSLPTASQSKPSQQTTPGKLLQCMLPCLLCLDILGQTISISTATLGDCMLRT